MNDTAQIILAISIGIVFSAAAFALIVTTIDMIKGWKLLSLVTDAVEAKKRNEE